MLFVMSYKSFSADAKYIGNAYYGQCYTNTLRNIFGRQTFLSKYKLHYYSLKNKVT